MDMTRQVIQKAEGYRERIYVDTVGVPTGGYGHAFHHNSRLPQYIWDMIFNYDFNGAVDTADILMGEYGIKDLSLPRRMVLIEMAYILGYSKLSLFKHMLTALKNKDYDQAALSIINSRMAKQIPSRTDRLAKTMADGRYPHV